MREHRLREEDIEQLISEPASEELDPGGRRRLTGTIRGRRFRVVLAKEDPNLVVTVHPRRK